ncbi:hypothetical protein DRA43_30735, partial [Micromonospora provocatoris]
MYDVVLLTLGSERDAPGGGCGSGGACCGGADDTGAEAGRGAAHPRLGAGRSRWWLRQRRRLLRRRGRHRR